MSTTINIPNTLLPDQAVLIATAEELVETSQWYSDGHYTFRFVRVPQFLYNTATAHLRSRMRKFKPKPPVVRKSGREMTNKADPRFIEDTERWKQEWEDLSTEANISTSMFRGIELHGPIPPLEEWLPGVLSDFESIGITEEEAYATFLHDKDRLHELWFKKFVILKSRAVTELFTDFQGTGGDKGDEEGNEDDIFAVELFQPEQE